MIMQAKRSFARFGPRRRCQGKGQIRVVLALLAVSLLLWYIVSPKESAPPGVGQDFPTPGSSVVKKGAPRDDGVPMVADAHGAIQRALPEAIGSTRGGDQARAIVAELREAGGTPDLEQVFEQAQRFQAAGSLADAYLLYFYAARQGHTSSAMILGTMYDPDYYSPDTSLARRPDLGQAHKWYQLAAKDGDPVAGEHLAHLRSTIEASAEAGDPEARRLVLQWR